jgi:hypothetical protein
MSSTLTIRGTLSAEGEPMITLVAEAATGNTVMTMTIDQARTVREALNKAVVQAAIVAGEAATQGTTEVVEGAPDEAVRQEQNGHACILPPEMMLMSPEGDILLDNVAESDTTAVDNSSQYKQSPDQPDGTDESVSLV